MALQKLTASLASGNAELQLALATLNLDVSLVKMEAPKEFQPLAHSLPSKRKGEAEDGSIHATVRKLQSLFSGLFTATPALYTAYGKRSSYISQKARAGEKNVSPGSPFAEHIGVEAGSIWAAATSGSTAVAIHLLACMLARVFTGPEAVAGWEEIVTIRKKQILDEAEAGMVDNLAALLAARTPLQRQDLAEWDASARAWLRIADEVMQPKQKQLLLIVNNQQRLPVNLHGNTFESIIQAWSRAMVAVEKLIQGMPQSIVDGSVLLALSAWHIYPDMSVLGDKNVFVSQSDSLVAHGGILTLGLQTGVTKTGQHSEEGVTWSLPLAYYRYYGPPTVTDRNLQTDGTRLSIQQLLLITIGSLLSKWKEKALNSVQIAHFVDGLFARLLEVPPTASRRNDAYRLSAKSWPSLLRETAKCFALSEGVDHEDGSRLIAFGRRKGSELLGINQDKDSPISQLQHPAVFLGLIRTADFRIRLLRQVAHRHRVSADSLVIRYAIDGADRGMTTRYGYANVVESGISNNGSIPKDLHRWESQSRALSGPSEIQSGLIENKIIKAPVRDDLRLFWCEPPSELQKHGLIETKVDEFFGDFAERAIFRDVDRNKPRKLKGVPFYFVWGDPSTAAIYQAYDAPSEQNLFLRTEDILSVLEHVSQPRLQAHLVESTTHAKAKSELSLSRHIRSLKAIATVVQIYEPLTSATIAISVIKRPMADAKWLPESTVHASEQVIDINRACKPLY